MIRKRSAYPFLTTMTIIMPTGFIALFFPALLLAQTTAATAHPVAFEVASIKPSAPLDARQVLMGQQRVGMKVDAARIDLANLSLADLIRIAYRVKRYQLAGPDWMTRERFDVVAKLPEGASPDRAPEMLQQLLAERFELAVHRETKEHAVYALVVGKNGPKLVEAPADAPFPDGSATPAAGGHTPGLLQLSPDTSSLMISGELTGPVRLSPGAGGAIQLQALKASMPALADMLSRILGQPVVDMTGLKGAYQLTLELSRQDMHAMVQAAGVMPPGPGMGGGEMHGPGSDAPGGAPGSDVSVFQNIQQMGLKLESRKAPMEVIVIDRLEKAPKEN
jgi:uncharacterized protein (TIGR03435 family)